MSTDCLPVIVVSAVDTATANKFISDIVSNSEVISSNGTSSCSEASGRVWPIDNKYYSAHVRLVSDGDEAEQRHCANEDEVEAHIIYLTETECESGAEAAAARRSTRGGDAAVRLLVTARGVTCPAPTDYELVALDDTEEEDEEFPSACGIARVREALHAHTWRGLRRRDAPRPLAAAAAAAGEEEAAVERAEQLVSALAALGRVAALPPAQRRVHADSMLAAFCAALGLHQDDL